MVAPYATKEEAAARMRVYRATHKEQIAATAKARRLKGRRGLRRKTPRNRKCAFCRILLVSKLVKPRCTKYCHTCKGDPDIQRYLRALYVNRWYSKKVGNGQPSLTISED